MSAGIWRPACGIAPDSGDTRSCFKGICNVSYPPLLGDERRLSGGECRAAAAEQEILLAARIATRKACLFARPLAAGDAGIAIATQYTSVNAGQSLPPIPAASFLSRR